MKLIHLTDTHLTTPGRMLYGINPLARLNAAIDHIRAQHADAELCVITGDLTHWGEAAAYASLREALRALPMPVLPLIGNHDNRDRFCAAFPDVPCDEAGFVQWIRDSSVGRFIFLDTVISDVSQGRKSAGYFDSGRLKWLRKQLDVSKTDAVQVFLFMHHPPFGVGISAFDEINIVSDDALTFGALLLEYTHIRHLFFGHIHRPISGSWHGIPFSTLPATAHQSGLDFLSDTDQFTHEAPGYGVVLITPGQVTVHICDFLYSGPHFHPASEFL